jgi:hypothetical protein
MRDRETLINRIRHLRRIKPDSEQRPTGAADAPPPQRSDGEDVARLARLEARIIHLEKLVEGLQDSVHRETERQGKLIAELQAQVHPEAMSAALSKDARTRGL